MASLWEIAIKVSIGRMPLPRALHTFLPQQLAINSVGLLAIEAEHIFEVARLPLHHRDPFDRMIIAQAIHDHLPIVSADSAFDSYPIRRLW